MKLTAPTFTPGKRQTLEKTKSWLENLRDSLAAKVIEFGDLDGRLRTAQARRAELSAKAGLDPDAALQLAGIEQQITHLGPIVKQKQRLLQNDIEVAGRQIATVRKDDIGEALGVPLFNQIKDAIALANAPFVSKTNLQAIASEIALRSVVWDAASSYVQRCAPRVPDAETALKWLAATVDELGEILSGETIIVADPATNTYAYPDHRAIERHSIKL